jgi:methionyl-tRNA synthetase
MKKPYYITTAIAYTSGKPHIGNVYEIVLSDALARFMRMYGYDVYFQTGTDEHVRRFRISPSRGRKPQGVRRRDGGGDQAQLGSDE